MRGREEAIYSNNNLIIIIIVVDVIVVSADEGEKLDKCHIKYRRKRASTLYA
jgi:hypothetical protein